MLHYTWLQRQDVPVPRLPLSVWVQTQTLQPVLETLLYIWHVMGGMLLQ